MALHRGRLRPKVEFAIESIKPIRREELSLLADLREDARPNEKGLIQRIRDPHHMLARFIAMGATQIDAARRAGYSANRVSLLMNSPAFQDLIAYYRKLVNEGWKEEVDEFISLATSNMMKAERMIADKLDKADEEDETLPTRDLIAISRDGADRLGYGKKTTNVNVNVDMAARLESAITRSNRARVVQAVPRGISPPLAPAPEANAGASPDPQKLRRV